MNKNNFSNELNQKKENNNFRTLKIISPVDLNLSSNDYIGIGQDKTLSNNFIDLYKDSFIFSSSGSRLISGNYKEIIELENEINKVYKKSSLVMNSGFSANKTIINTFFNKNSLIITDKLNHASIYDGIVSSQGKVVRYRHLDLLHLENLLIKYSPLYSDILVITETIYSMEGDTADLSKFVALKKKYNFSLMVDEAHSFGVYGYGLAYENKLVQDIDFLVIPLGKGGGSIGAYIICDNLYRDYIINYGREFIYTTSIPPINTLWNLFIFKNIPNFKDKRNQLEILKDFSLKKIKELNILTFSNSHILSLIIGDNIKADIICANLRKEGYVVYPIKSPTVPKGSERIRVGLNPNITTNEMNKFLRKFKDEYNNLF